MFFNSNMKIAAQIAIATEKCLALALSSTQYYRAGHINLSSEMWEDKYIAAFTHHLAGLFVKYDYSSKSWSQKKNDAVFMMALENLCGDGCRRLIRSVEEGGGAPEHKYEFERAVNDAASLYLAATNRLKPNDDSPVIKEVKQALIAAKQAHPDQKFTGAELAPTICAFTIGRHIRDKY